MVAAFAGEFFWKSVRDFRAWIGLVGLVAAGIGGAIGKPIILPTWVWLLIAFASAISMVIRAEWKAYRDAEAQLEPDMKLVDVVKRIVGSDDILVGENCSKTGTALLTIRERGHLGQIAVWARRDVVAEDMDLCPRTSIPAPYWDAFDINYLKFLDDQRGESQRVRSHPEPATPFTSVWPQDVIYRDFWFSAHQVEKNWPLPKRRIKLQWPIRVDVVPQHITSVAARDQQPNEAAVTSTVSWRLISGGATILGVVSIVAVAVWRLGPLESAPPVSERPAPGPLVTAQPAPSTTSQPAPSVTAQPEPSVTLQPTPSVTAQPASVTAEPALSPAPPVTAEPAPSITSQPAPRVTPQSAPLAPKDVSAMYSQANRYYFGQGVAQDYAKAREWYEKAADQGNVDAMFNLGFLYANGQGVAQDYSKAREWYEKATANDNASAMVNLARLYANGQGVAQDYAKAREWYEKAVAKDNVSAMVSLGFLYANGQGVAQNYAKARDLYERAAANGSSANAMFNLGTLYINGQGVAQDYAKAREWYEKAAEKGDVEATFNLGFLYANGQGVAQDYAKAREWYEKAADKGSANAMLNLGTLYANGWGVAQDYAKARELYEEAAAQGSTNAMFNLGTFYDYGRGVAQDYSKAREWYQKAADKGDADAKARLDELRIR
jgi:TPR repeat protein